MVFPPIWGKKWRRSEHAHASYPGLILVPRASVSFGHVVGEKEGSGSTNYRMSVNK